MCRSRRTRRLGKIIPPARMWWLCCRLRSAEMTITSSFATRSTRRGLILDTIGTGNRPYLIHISSSVVESVADTYYTDTKKEQERIVLESGVPCPVLRPTLMFGWFDRAYHRVSADFIGQGLDRVGVLRSAIIAMIG
jgi:uncharacterized protein YbjT (DUF2867 family)